MDITTPFPPHVPLILYVPATQFALPPGMVTSEKVPVVPSTGLSSMSTAIPLGFFTKMIMAVPGPGGGATVPDIVIGCAPEYADLSV